ncbi:MAG TPA: GNAT family N-acetyltransferase [Tepidimicrobium sp.]|nr:GNAT family N-acetyltransferase [Tepidimicrobium sp.]
MIELRQIKKDEYDEVYSILDQENIESDLSRGIIYTLKDNGIIIGAGKAVLQSDYAIIKYIVVGKEFRDNDLGDILLRTLLFKLENMGILNVFFPHRDGYLMKKGFTSHDFEHMNSYELYLNIPRFFNKSCCGDQCEI